MDIHVKACEVGEPVMVLDDGRIILGEDGQVALILSDRARSEVATVLLDAEQAWSLADSLVKERRKALTRLRGGARASITALLGRRSR